MGLFQRTGKKPQRESWQKISERLFLQFGEQHNTALQQNTICKKQAEEPTTNIHSAHAQQTSNWVLL